MSSQGTSGELHALFDMIRWILGSLYISQHHLLKSMYGSLCGPLLDDLQKQTLLVCLDIWITYHTHHEAVWFLCSSVEC